jgi:hypothetical protein
MREREKNCSMSAAEENSSRNASQMFIMAQEEEKKAPNKCLAKCFARFSSVALKQFSYFLRSFFVAARTHRVENVYDEILEGFA